MPTPVVVITGASSGLGAGLAVELARQTGARIGLLARRIERLEEVAEAVREAGGEAVALPCDVVDPEAVQAAVDRVRELFGPVDLAIANAGIGVPLRMARFRVEKVTPTMRINFEGATNLFAAVVPEMWERSSGQVVGVSSIAAFRGLPGSGPYSASKAALSTMLESMRLELRPRGIAVTTIHPGFVTTDLTAKNKFKMPFLMDVDRASKLMVKGILKRRREVNFPWQMIALIKAARWMPDWAYDRLLGGRAAWTIKKNA
jgi:short-subunit dehydrogenase